MVFRYNSVKMKKMKLFYIFFFFYNPLIYSQIQNDTIVKLTEVVVKSTKKNELHSQHIATTLDNYLQNSAGINFIKRGAYAWEPILHNMLSERALVTIDGMRIFNACADKMDATTSFMEMNNLSEVEVNLGQRGTYGGANIAGNINLQSKKALFSEKKQWKKALQSGVESNNLHQFLYGNVGFSSSKIASEFSFSARKADNYKSGNGLIIKYSQYEKQNYFYTISAKISPQDIISANVVYDTANNVGFPSLPMDTSKSNAFIGMIKHEHFFQNKMLKRWLSKVYYNAINHEMGDAYRAESDKLPIKMDMPSQSVTFGVISELSVQKNDFLSNLKLTAFENTSVAEMLMYYRSGGTMFTYTWPNVQTRNGSFSTENSWKMNEKTVFSFTTNLEYQQNYIKSDVGYNLNQVFHQFERKKHHFVFNLYGFLEKKYHFWTFEAGFGIGNRLPSVSEGYGFYIFNSSDGFDYIGNPNLKKELSFEGNFSVKYKKNSWEIRQNATFFHIKNYIFGIPKGEITWQMTPLGENKRGIKIYENLPFAQQLNLSTDVKYSFSGNYYTKGQIGYAYGRDFEGRALPFIRPLYGNFSVGVQKKTFFGEIGVSADAKQGRFSVLYGEDATPSYVLLNASLGYVWEREKYRAEIRLGADNLLDRQYSTYADWKNFPRMGRNFMLTSSLKW